jgi:hypothetical protein
MRRLTLTVAAALTFAAFAIPGAASAADGESTYLAVELKNVQVVDYQLGALDSDSQAAGANTNDLRGKILRIKVNRD